MVEARRYAARGRGRALLRAAGRIRLRGGEEEAEENAVARAREHALGQRDVEGRARDVDQNGGPAFWARNEKSDVPTNHDPNNK